MRRVIPTRTAVIQCITVLVLLTPLIGAGVFVGMQHQQIAQSLSDLEPRYARMLGLLARKADLLAASESAKAQLKLKAYPMEQDSTVSGNDAQQRIRALFADSRLNVISIQVLAAKEEDGFDKIVIDLRVEGDLTGIQNALALLAAQKPMVTVDEVNLQTIGAVLPASVQRVAGQFLFSVLRARQ